jgi:hypothetical protein
MARRFMASVAAAFDEKWRVGARTCTDATITQVDRTAIDLPGVFVVDENDDARKHVEGSSA